MCKMIISPGVFFSVFQNFDFSGCEGSERAKMAQNDKNSVMPYISGTLYHMIIMVHLHVCIKGKYLQAFFHFFKILMFGIIGQKMQKRAKNGTK